MIHGITIRHKVTKKLSEFIPCGTGRTALLVLSGARRNLGRDYCAEEEVVEQSELDALKL